jgi:hypothetical protein
MTSARKHKKAHATAAPGGAEAHGGTRTMSAHNGHEGHEGHEGHPLGLHVHTLHADLPIPYLTPGDIGANARAATSRLPSLPGLPSPRRLAFYGGLGALAVTGLIDWPVAAAIGVATVVARGRGEEREAEERQTTRAEQPARQVTAQPPVTEPEPVRTAPPPGQPI